VLASDTILRTVRCSTPWLLNLGGLLAIFEKKKFSAGGGLSGGKSGLGGKNCNRPRRRHTYQLDSRLDTS